jgi:uncharacterized membrane protein YhaH (DUF805 family)
MNITDIITYVLIAIAGSIYYSYIDKKQQREEEEQAETLMSRFFQGRINRRTFYVGILADFLLLCSSLLILKTGNLLIVLVWILLSIPLCYIFFSTLTIRRAHDRGEAGHDHIFFSLLIIADEFANLILPGDKSDNKFGKQPEKNINFKELFLGQYKS